MNTRYKTYLADTGLIFAAFAWGSTFFLVKDSLTDISAVALVGYRFLLAAIVLGTALKLKGVKVFANFKQGFVLGLLLWLLYVPQTIGLGITSAANSGFITGLFVAFVPLLSFLFLKKLPTTLRLVAVAMSVAGLFILTGGLNDINGGDLLTLITAMAYAAHILVADTYVKGEGNPYVLSFQQFLTVGLLSFLVSFVTHGSLVIGSSKVVGVIIFLALIPTLVAFVTQLVAQKFTAPVKVALIFALEPVFAAMFAWTIGNEAFHVQQALGGILIVAAMIIAELPTLKKDK